MATREERLEQVFWYVMDAGRPVTISEIARALDLVKSPYLIDIVNELIDAGSVLERVSRTWNGLPIRFICPIKQDVPIPWEYQE